MTTKTKLFALAFVAAAFTATTLTGAMAAQRAHFAGVSASTLSPSTTATCGLSNCWGSPPPAPPTHHPLGPTHDPGGPGGNGGGIDGTEGVACQSERDCGPLSED